MYDQEKDFYSSESSPNEGGYGYNYRNYRLSSEVSLKGKIEQKYWRTKQKAIEKLGKEQDEFVISGDAEVDARLEAFQHIRMTCMQLMYAIDIYQNKIFALSQDENEMGRFLREQGALDKTKAGKMMIAVGKAQSFAAQQRLGLRASLARLFSELETFRFRAIQDTQITITKMEQSRSDYRARLLWMADISKELDPEQMKRLDKYRDVQQQVKLGKQSFDRLKGDVIQKIDLLSASRCNLLSATLEPYQTAMITFLSSTSKSYNTVYQQFQGYPSFQFTVLKNIIPNNGIVDDDDDDYSRKKGVMDEKEMTKLSLDLKEMGKEREMHEHTYRNEEDDKDDDDKLISFDMQDDNTAQSSLIETKEVTGDLLGSLDADLSPDFGKYTSASENLDKIKEKRNEECPSVDELLFGLASNNEQENTLSGCAKSDMDLLSDVLNNQSLGINDRELNNSFSSQWQSMFGSSDTNESSNTVVPPSNIVDGENNESEPESQTFMPSFLLDQLSSAAPLSKDATKGLQRNKESFNFRSNTNSLNQRLDSGSGKDMSKWLSLFADLDPLSNPDAIGSGAGEPISEGKQAC